MKVKNLFIISLAALSLVACSNDEDSAPKMSSVVVNLTSTAPKTKATTKAPEDFGAEALASLDAEKTISSGTLYVFEGDLFITSVAITSTSVTIPSLTVGNTYNFAAVVNPGENSITKTTKVDLRKEVIALSAKTSGAFVMYGESTESLEVKENQNNSLSVEVKRVLSGVQLVSIKTAFKAGTPDFATKGTAVVKSLQLLNTYPTSALNGDVIKVDEKIEGIAATFGNGLSFDSEETGVVVNNDNSVRAYCCPGVVGYVVLNVTYTYQDQTYDRAYNIPTLTNLDGGLLANYLYGLKVTLTGAGSDEGGDPDKFAEATATLSVANWSNGQIHDVEQDN